MPGLNARKYDFILAPTTLTEERAKTMLFTEGYLDTDYMFVQKKTAKPIESLEGTKGLTISVNKGSAYESWAKANAESLARARTALSGIERLDKPNIAALSVALRTLRSVIRSGAATS